MPIHVSYELDSSELPQECIEDCSASGDVTEAVYYWVDHLAFTVDRARTLACLAGYGAWEDEELAAMDDRELAAKVLWLACGNFRDQPPEDSDYGSAVFVLE